MKEKTKGQRNLERIIYIVLAIVIIVRFTQSYMDLRQRQSVEMGNQPVPDFVWRDFESNKHSLAQIKDKVIVLHFWASWCAPCRTEFPAMLRAAKTLENEAVFLTISADETDTPVKKFLIAAKDAAGTRPDNVLYGWDPMHAITFDLFQSTAFPETIIIDESMKMRRKILGKTDWENPEIIEYIRNLKNPDAGDKPAAVQKEKPDEAKAEE